MNQTVELVKQLALKPEFTYIPDHYKKLESVLGTRLLPRTIVDLHPGFVEKAIEKGFRFFVTPQFALKFKYHAYITSPQGASVGKFTADWGNYGGSCHISYRYCGDIPDKVLDNIEVLKYPTYCGDLIYPHITVHSMEVLPIRVERIPRQIEPVAIWWGDNPKFDYTWLGWRCWKPGTIGVVIGIWDMDKEIEIL